MKVICNTLEYVRKINLSGFPATVVHLRPKKLHRVCRLRPTEVWSNRRQARENAKPVASAGKFAWAKQTDWLGIFTLIAWNTLHEFYEPISKCWTSTVDGSRLSNSFDSRRKSAQIIIWNNWPPRSSSKFCIPHRKEKPSLVLNFSVKSCADVKI